MKKAHLVLQANYENISLSLWNGTHLITSYVLDKINACKLLMPSIINLLQEHNFNFSDIDFIAINQGPAPFTTLRIVITTANGLSFSKKIPLIPINSLEAFSEEYKTLSPLTVIILNAFAQDVYFSIIENKKIKTGCKNSDIFFDELINDFPNKNITFIGNGVELFKEKIKNIFKENALFLNPNPQYTDFKQTSLIAYSDWVNKKNITEVVIPLYLKIQTYKTST